VENIHKKSRQKDKKCGIIIVIGYLLYRYSLLLYFLEKCKNSIIKMDIMSVMGSFC